MALLLPAPFSGTTRNGRSKLLDHCGVTWLVETEFSASWESDPGHRSPPRLLDFGALDTSCGEPLELSIEIAAHEVQVQSV